MKGKIIIAILVLAMASAAIAAYLYNKPASATMSGAPDYTLTADGLFAEFEQNEEAANQKYLNKTVAVTGKIASVTTGGNNSSTLTLETGSPMFGVSCDIQDAANTAALKVGETVTVKGLCTGMLMDVVLVKCSVEN